ncbi:MAG: hypothetical protein COA43_09085 [Robiginitomaculum sp.]|nr:MAG: hypothetical protein COA43_09085 [Robiginitomaculum sp.]
MGAFYLCKYLITQPMHLSGESALDNFTQTEIIFGIAFLVFLYLLWQKKQPDKNGRLPDSAITADRVEKLIINEFSAKITAKTSSPNEKTIQEQLYNFLESKILHVQEHKPIGGVTNKKIDFDIGCGAVGIEIKIGKSAFKNTERNRLVGQITDYNKANYSNDNLLLLIFCDVASFKQRVFHKDLLDTLANHSVRVHFLPIISPYENSNLEI